MSSRQRNDGLYKRCACARRKWLKCEHPWHFDFYKGKKFRFSLDVIAKARGEQPPRNKGDAEALADQIRSEIRKGEFRDPNSPPTPTVPEGLRIPRIVISCSAHRDQRVHVIVIARSTHRDRSAATLMPRQCIEC